MAKFSVPVLNVGGMLGEDENGVLKYNDGETKRFQALDIDLLSIPEIESMMKSLGYPNYSALYWLQPNAVNLEFGLRAIKKESDMKVLRKMLLESDCKEFHIFIEHLVSKPISAEVEQVNLDSDADSESSSSHDSYESTEDEEYKPPPDGYDLSGDSDGGKSKKVKKRGRTKKITTPKKKASPKKNGKNTPTRKRSRRLGGDEFCAKDDLDDVVGGKAKDAKDAKAAEGDECGQKVKKKWTRKYAGKRKEKSMPNFGPKFGSSGSGSQPTSDAGGCNGPKGAARVVEPIVEEVDSEEDKEYVYESEAFVSPISSDEEGHNSHKWTQHDTGYGYGEVYFELGMEFDTMEKFRNALKDYFVF
ncbi:hypothetical protein PIB30_025595 [Stylosanthes scabra]|uniref:PB1-like domain-containing protein n=1 Tax=Stylosanthes scabra TaxID=79078 RepID=A0ABU6S9S7_9FABA|nr:hypothetical protein [Stylosanthes scabra]